MGKEFTEEQLSRLRGIVGNDPKYNEALEILAAWPNGDFLVRVMGRPLPNSIAYIKEHLLATDDENHQKYIVLGLDVLAHVLGPEGSDTCGAAIAVSNCPSR